MTMQVLAAPASASLDLSGGQQPISNEDGTLGSSSMEKYLIIFELRPVLEQRGHSFSTHSDTKSFCIFMKNMEPIA